MDIGLLWHDSSKIGLEDKLTRAKVRYVARFGHEPNVCYVHKTASAGQCAGMCIVPAASILQHHFWLGKEEDRQVVVRPAVRQDVTGEQLVLLAL